MRLLVDILWGYWLIFDGAIGGYLMGLLVDI